MSALLALDTHPFAPGPAAGWADSLWATSGADVIACQGLPIVETDQELGDLVAVVADLSRLSDAVLVLYPVTRQARAEALLRTLRRVNPVPVARVSTRLPPLSAAVLALLLRRLGGRPGWDAGRLAAAVPLLEQQLTTVGWVRRITRPILTGASPDPAAPHLVARWLSVNGFELRLDHQHPAGLQIVAHRGVPVAVPEGSLAFTVASRSDDERLTSVTSAPTSAGSPGDPARSWFGTSRSAEMVVLTSHLATFTEAIERDLAARVQVRACEWCRLQTPAGPRAHGACAFCGHHPGGPAPTGPDHHPEPVATLR